MNKKTNFFVIIALGLIAISSSSSILSQLKDEFSNFANSISGTVNFADFFKSVTPIQLESLSENDLTSLGKQRLQDFINSGRGKLSEHVQNVGRSALLKLLTPDEVYTELNRATSMSDIVILCTKLPQPSLWTRDIIAAQWNSLRKCPAPLLLQATDQNTLLEMKNRIGGDRQMKTLQIQLILKYGGDPSTWTNETIKSVTLDEFILPFVCPRVQSIVLISKINDIANAATRLDPDTRRTCLDKLVEGLRLNTMTDIAQVQSTILLLRNLQSDLTPSDFNEQIRKNPIITTLMTNNIRTIASSNLASISPDLARSVMEKFGNMTNITANIINQEGVCSFAYAYPSDIRGAMMNQSIATRDIVNMIKCWRTFDGPGASDKLLTFIDMIRNETKGISAMTFSNYEPELLKLFDWRDFRKTNPSDARNILAKPCNLTIGNIGALMAMLQPADYRSIYQNVREYIPVNKLTSLTGNDLVLMSKDLPPGSPLTLKAGEMYMQTFRNPTIQPTDVQNLLQVLPFIQAKDARKLNDSNILGVLKVMKDINPGFPAIKIMQEIFRNYTANVSESFRDDPLSFLTGTDFENVPVCFCASFGQYIRNCEPSEKIVMLMRLGVRKNFELSCTRPNCIAIVTEGLRALSSATGIQPGETDIVGNSLFCAPADEIQNTHENEKLNVIMKANDLINQMRYIPCLSTEQRNAFAKLIKDVKGSNLALWKSIKSICCILFVIGTEARNLKPEVAASCSCDLNELSPTDRMKEAICMGSLGERNFNLTKETDLQFKQSLMQAAAGLSGTISVNSNNNTMYNNSTNTTTNNRLKRQASTTSSSADTCDKAAYGGADCFTADELKGLSQNVLYGCMKFFGSKDMEQEKADILGQKILEYRNYNLQNMNPQEMEDMKYILKGIPDTSLRNAPYFAADRFDNVVIMLGQMAVFSIRQVEELSRKVVNEWSGNNIGRENASRLIIMNQLICGFSREIFVQINVDAFRGAINVLALLQNCPRDYALIGLFSKAKEAFGDISLWNASDVANLGCIFAGIMPEEWMKIRCEALEGLSPAAVQRFDEGSINAMNGSHIACMNPAAIAAFRDDQKAYFSPSMMQAIRSYSSSDYQSFSDRNFARPHLIFILIIFALK